MSVRAPAGNRWHKEPGYFEESLIKELFGDHMSCGFTEYLISQPHTFFPPFHLLPVPPFG